MAKSAEELDSKLTRSAPGIPAGAWKSEEIVARLGMISAGAYLFFVQDLVRVEGGLSSYHSLVVLHFILYGIAFTLFAVSGIGRVSLRTAGFLSLVAVLAGVGYIQYASIVQLPHTYLFDVLTVTHRAAELVTDGKDPYAIRHNAEFIYDAAQKFNNPLFFVTVDAKGAQLDQLMVYPAGHILVFVPAVLLGLHDMRWIVVTALLAVVVILWWQAPPIARPMAALPLLVDPEQSFFYPAAGISEVLWLIPMMFTAIMFSRQKYGWAGLFYGLTVSIKQQPWLLAPFLLIWLWKEAGPQPPAVRLRLIARFIAISAGVFLIVNLPFMVWGFNDWLYGVAYPFTAHLSNIGIGLPELRFIGIDPGKTFFTITAVTSLTVLFVVYWRYFQGMRHYVWMFPVIVLWFAYRPLGYYFGPWILMLTLGLFLGWREAMEKEVSSSQEVAVLTPQADGL